MDDIEIFVFYCTFDRISDDIDFKGKIAVEEIEAELHKAKKEYEKLQRTTKKSQNKDFKRIANNYGKLLENDFASKIIAQAEEKPEGLIAMTIKFGKREATKRVFSQMIEEYRKELRHKHIFLRKCCTYGKRTRKTKVGCNLDSQSLPKGNDTNPLQRRVE